MVEWNSAGQMCVAHLITDLIDEKNLGLCSSGFLDFSNHDRTSDGIPEIDRLDELKVHPRGEPANLTTKFAYH